jgi:hypothetical protein
MFERDYSCSRCRCTCEANCHDGVFLPAVASHCRKHIRQRDARDRPPVARTLASGDTATDIGETETMLDARRHKVLA